MHGRMRYNGKIHQTRNKRLPPGSWSLISIHLVVEEAQHCLPQVQKGQDPEIVCHQFSPCQSLVHFSLCLQLATLVPVPGQHYIATFRPMLGPALEAVIGYAWLPGCMTSVEKEYLNRQVSECMLQKEAFVKLWLYYLGLQKDQVLSGLSQTRKTQTINYS